jgi:UDPglucose--hexose-1-phosphate uridylyltransferase
MSELRKDPATNRWVITLDDKSFKPQTDSKLSGEIPEHDGACPFCTGNEDKTGKTIYSVNDMDGKWKVRVIPNNNPYLKVETQLKKHGVGIFDVISGTGANEVIIETGRHDMDFERFEPADIEDIFRTYRDRILDLRRDSRIEYILIFKNRGARAGAKTAHLHSQLMALPIVPEKVSEELKSSAQYYEFKGRCVYCDIIENELMLKDRVIKESEHFVTVAPFASQTPFETWIFPKDHAAHFHKLSNIELKEVAIALKDAVTRLNKALNHPSYNYMIHTAPIKEGDLEHYHWHIEILPRIKPVAGFEWGSGFFINPTLPEEAAAYMRKL